MSRVCITAGWSDVPHLGEAEKADLLSSYPEYEREARSKGLPLLGSGRVFPVDESLIRVEPFAIPPYFRRIAGTDFGWDHPTAAAWLAWDPDPDTIYVYDTYRAREKSVVIHAAAFKSRGEWIPMAWPHDGLNETSAGPQLAKQYKQQGVKMRPENAKLPIDPLNPSRSRVSPEAGYSIMLTRMQTSQLKVFSHLHDWFEEFRLLHRDEGVLVKTRDDLMSATRMAIMDLRYAIVKPQSQTMTLVPPYEPLDRVMGY